MSSPPLPVSAELFAPLFPLFLSAAKPAARSSLFAPLFPLILSAPKPAARSSPFQSRWVHSSQNCLLARTSAGCIFSERLDQIFNSLCMSSKVLFPFFGVGFSFFCCNKKWLFLIPKKLHTCVQVHSLLNLSHTHTNACNTCTKHTHTHQVREDTPYYTEVAHEGTQTHT